MAKSSSGGLRAVVCAFVFAAALMVSGTAFAEETPATFASNPVIPVSVGFPSDTVMTEDDVVYLSYSDDLFAQSADVYNDDLGYASVCLAASSENSNTQGSNYAAKSVNIRSFMEQIGCYDIATNPGYSDKPMRQSNIGVAIGWKPITVQGTTYKLFVIGVRGGGYEEEWEKNMVLGESGDHQGFQEARDAALSFIMPYLRDHVSDSDNVKIWMSGYCRGGTVTNMVAGWLGKWIYERNNGQTYAGYSSSYEEDHSVLGLDYDASLGRCTMRVSYPCSYVAEGATFSERNVYCYPVNCPQGAEAADVEAHEGLTVGIHNLINPDDWFPQVPMAWFGFARYGQSRDHDITGYYETPGALAARNMPALTTDFQKVYDTIDRVRTINKEGGYDAAWFRQYYFSKAKLSFVLDENGEGNTFVSKGAELAYNQGAYFEEFFRFLLDAAGCDSRATYAREFQGDFCYFMRMIMGPPVEVREKVGGVLQRHALEEFQKALDVDLSSFSGKFKAILQVPYLMRTDITVLDGVISSALGSTLEELGIEHDPAGDAGVGALVAKLLKGSYEKENNLGAFNFYHLTTMYKNAAGVSQTHRPEVAISWFKQSADNPFLNSTQSTAPAQEEAVAAASANDTADGQAGTDGATDDAQGENTIVEPTYKPGEHYIACRLMGGRLPDFVVRKTGDVLGQLPYDGELLEEGVVIVGWNRMDTGEKIDATYVFKADDPAEMALVADVQPLESRTLQLHANLDGQMDATANDVVGQVLVYKNGKTDITDEERYLPGGQIDEGVVHYQAPMRAGYTFWGWQTKPDENGRVGYHEPDDTLRYDDANSGDDNLYAVWMDNAVYTLRYHPNGADTGTDTSVEDVVDGQGSLLVAQNTMSKEGYAFDGWNTKADGTGLHVNAGAVVSPTELSLPAADDYRATLGTASDEQAYVDAATAATADLYAQWKKEEAKPAEPKGNNDATPKTPTAAAKTKPAASTPSKAATAKTGDEAAPLAVLGIVVIAAGAAFASRRAQRRS